MKYQPMLCQGSDTPPEGDGWFGEVKHDGWRFTFERGLDGIVRSYAGRNSADRTGQPKQIEEALADLIPIGTIIDCELTSVGKGGTRSGAVGHALAHGGELHAHVFDLLELGGSDTTCLRFEERRAALKALFDEALARWACVSMGQAACIPPESRQDIHDRLVKAGAEGTVWKHRDSLYVPGNRGIWIKVKHNETIDVKVIGFKEGKGRFAGMIAALDVELDSGVTTTTKLKDDAMIRHVTEIVGVHEPRKPGAAAYLGRIVELKHYGLTADGVPKHPTFMRWREDKDACHLPHWTNPDTGKCEHTDHDTPRASVEPRPTTTHKPPTITARNSGGKRKRNYGSMGPDKLDRTLRELKDAVANGAVNEATRKEPTGEYKSAIEHIEELKAR